MPFAAFKEGELLLPQNPSEVAAQAVAPEPVVPYLLIVAFAILIILAMRSFTGLFPSLLDCIVRVRGSFELENSIKKSHDRNIIAWILLLPAVFLIWRYRLYYPSFYESLDSSLLVPAIAGTLLAYLIVRLLLYRSFQPRRNEQAYTVSHYSAYTFWVILLMEILPLAGILHLFRVDEAVIRTVIYVITALSYLLYIARRAQILSLSCNHLRTFSYLCALELLPTHLLVLSGLL